MNLGIETTFTRKEKIIFLGALAFFFVWAFYLADAYANFFKTNIFIGTFFFISAYVVFIYGFYLKNEAVSVGPKDWNDYLGYIFIFIAFDIISYPIMIPQAGFAGGLAPVQQLSADVAVYDSISYAFKSFSHIIKYAITYTIVPWLLLVLARIFLTKQQFWNVIKVNPGR